MTDDSINEHSIHQWSAAYVLGALDPEDRSEFEIHLATCEVCQRNVLEFSPLPGLLGHIQPEELELSEELEAPTSTIDGALDKARAEHRSVETSRSRWRRAAIALTAAAAVLIGTIIVWPNDDPTFGGPLEELVIHAESPITGTVAVSERDWGTRLEIDLFDVPRRDRYSLWTVSSEGAWDLAGTWAYAVTGTCRIVGASPVATADLDRVVVTSDDKADELVWASRGAKS